jgi:hypothetical protein
LKFIINRNLHCQSHCRQIEADNKRLLYLSLCYLFIYFCSISLSLSVSHTVGNITTDGRPKRGRMPERLEFIYPQINKQTGSCSDSLPPADQLSIQCVRITTAEKQTQTSLLR